MKKFYFLFGMILWCTGVFSQTLYDSYSDGNYTVAPVWAGTAAWGIQANSDVAAGATGSQTLRLAAAAVSTTDYLSSQFTTWGASQEWGFFFGRRAQALTGANRAFFWLYANEANLTSATVDGYRISIGDDSGDDEFRLEYIVNGAVSATVLTSATSVTNGRTDFGMLIRVTRSATGAWELFTSAFPAANGTGSIATDIPNAANANLSQGTAINNTLPIADNGYIGVAALHSTGANAIIAQEFDQIYFTPTLAGVPNIIVTPITLTGFISLSGVPSAEQTYTVQGSDLTADIVITPPAGFEISTTTAPFTPTNPITLTQTGGTVALTTIYVRMNSITLGVNTGDITHVSAGSNDPDVTLTGNVIEAEPTIQSTITIGAVTNSTVVVNFTGGNGTRRILLAKLATPVSSDPADGTTYTANANFGSGSQIGAGNFVVYDGIGNTQLVTGLTAGATYHFAIFDYNDGGVAGAENYLIPGGVGNATLDTYAVPYVWVGLNGDWQVPTNWAPARLFPATNDSLLFTSAAVSETVTNVPSQTVGYIGVSLLTNTTLQAATTGNVLTIGDLTGTDLFVEAGSALHISGANALTANLVPGATASINGAMTFTTGAHRLTATTAGAISFNNGAVFTAGTAFSGNAFGNAGANASSVVFANGSTYQQIGGSNPFALGQPASVVVFNTGSLFRLMAELTPSVSGRTYANFELDYTPVVTPISATGSGLLTMDNLTVTNGSITFGMTTAGFNLRGNVSVAAGGVLNFAPATAGTLRLNGTTLQSISNLGILTFGANQNVEINNTAGVTLNTPVTLLANLTFTSGLVNTTGINLLTMGVASTVVGASNASYVNGPVKKIGNTAFTFPVGKLNGYIPIRISGGFVGGAATDEFTAEYIRSSAAALGPVTAPFIDHVSYCEYWTLVQNVGATTVDLTLYWTANNTCGGGAYITNLSELEIAHFDAVNWSTSSTGFSATNGDAFIGDITWPGVNVFGPFAFASSTALDNPLPITINYFNGAKQNGGHLLNWKVTCFNTPNATLELERSTDGRNYGSIYSIYATALRCQQPFDYTDNAPAKGTNYYRLKMTDADGKISYSSIVHLINADKGMDILNIAPNPIVNGNFNVKVSAAGKTQMELLITDMQGRVLQKINANLIAGFNAIPVNVRNLAAGTYQLYGNTADGRTRVLRFVVQ